MAFATISDLMFNGLSLSGQERNSLFLNTGTTADGTPQRFAQASFLSGFGFDDDARGLALADWDHDGDLDVWLSNRTAPRLRFLKNQTPASDDWLSVRLIGQSPKAKPETPLSSTPPSAPQSSRDAIGAKVQLRLPSGRVLHSRRRCGEGFLSQSSAALHWGFIGEAAGPLELTVLWPSGRSQVWSGLTRGTRLILSEGEKEAQVLPAAAPVTLAAKPTEKMLWSSTSRTPLISRLPLPEIDSQLIQAASSPPPPKTKKSSPTSAKPSAGTLLVFFATWCEPCIEEIKALSAAASSLTQAGLSVRLLNVDELDERPQEKEFTTTKTLLQKLKCPYVVEAITPATAGTLDVFHRSFLSLRRPLPLPSSYLLDADGRLAVIYRGPVTAEQVMADLPLLSLSGEALRAASTPFPGPWDQPLPPTEPITLITLWKRHGILTQGARWIESFLSRSTNDTHPHSNSLTPAQQVSLYTHLADFRKLAKDENGYAAAYQQALKISPDHEPSLTALGLWLGQNRRLDEAVPLLEKAHSLLPQSPQTIINLAIARSMQRRPTEAISLFRRALELDPSQVMAHLNLARLYAQSGQFIEAEASLRATYKLQPDHPGIRSLWPTIRDHLEPTLRAEADLLYFKKK